MKHIWYEHKGGCPNPGRCAYCDGGLSFCTVCGGFEGTLTADCCNFKLHETVLEAVYKGGLDFKNDLWSVSASRDG